MLQLRALRQILASVKSSALRIGHRVVDQEALLGVIELLGCLLGHSSAVLGKLLLHRAHALFVLPWLLAVSHALVTGCFLIHFV